LLKIALSAAVLLTLTNVAARPAVTPPAVQPAAEGNDLLFDFHTPKSDKLDF
jgi:hypothetical protein